MRPSITLSAKLIYASAAFSLDFVDLAFLPSLVLSLSPDQNWGACLAPRALFRFSEHQLL